MAWFRGPTTLALKPKSEPTTASGETVIDVVDSLHVFALQGQGSIILTFTRS